MADPRLRGDAGSQKPGEAVDGVTQPAQQQPVETETEQMKRLLFAELQRRALVSPQAPTASSQRQLSPTGALAVARDPSFANTLNQLGPSPGQQQFAAQQDVFKQQLGDQGRLAGDLTRGLTALSPKVGVDKPFAPHTDRQPWLDKDGRPFFAQVNRDPINPEKTKITWIGVTPDAVPNGTPRRVSPGIQRFDSPDGQFAFDPQINRWLRIGDPSPTGQPPPEAGTDVSGDASAQTPIEREESKGGPRRTATGGIPKDIDKSTSEKQISAADFFGQLVQFEEDAFALLDAGGISRGGALLQQGVREFGGITGQSLSEQGSLPGSRPNFDLLLTTRQKLRRQLALENDRGRLSDFDLIQVGEFLPSVGALATKEGQLIFFEKVQRLRKQLIVRQRIRYQLFPGNFTLPDGTPDVDSIDFLTNSSRSIVPLAATIDPQTQRVIEDSGELEQSGVIFRSLLNTLSPADRKKAEAAAKRRGMIIDEDR